MGETWQDFIDGPNIAIPAHLTVDGPDIVGYPQLLPLSKSEKPKLCHLSVRYK